MSGFLTVPAIATELGVNVGKVYGWIDAGELRAINLATSAHSRRQRLKVRRQDLDRFLEGRATGKPKTTPQRRTPRKPQEGFVEYY